MITHRNSYEVKFDIRPNGLLCVPVKINGEGPFLFVLDTGCGGNWISPEVAQRLQLRHLDFANKHAHITIVELAIESARLRHQFISVRDCSDLCRVAQGQVDGMLGYPFINNLPSRVSYLSRAVIHIDPVEEAGEHYHSIMEHSHNSLPAHSHVV